jgi:amino acid adenylation domain-containing protein
LVREVFEAEQRMLEHRRYPVAQLQREYGGNKPLFEASFNFTSFHVYEAISKLDGIEILGGDIFEFNNFTLTAQFNKDVQTSEVQLTLKYKADELTNEQVEALGGYYVKALAALARAPHERYELESVLSSEERRRLLSEWNETEAVSPQDRCLHQLFEEQAAQTPDAPCLFFEEEVLSYGEVNRRANRLARALKRLGVGPEKRVGLCLDTSLELVVGMLGILKAGGAYVPLSPGYPTERLLYVLEDAETEVVVTLARVGERLHEYGGEVVCLDADGATASEEDAENPGTPVGAANLAYVLYTSGSTGKPKGVGVEHRQVLNYTAAVAQRVGFRPGFSYAMVQPLTVDSSVTVLFGSLLSGGVLHLIAAEVGTDAHALGEYFSRHPVDCLKIAPSHLAALQSTSRPELVMPRRRLVIGGEGSQWSWVQRLQELAPECVIFNHYGPTETTVGVLAYRVEREQFAQPFNVTPLGRPLANTQVYVLDEHMQPTPTGTPGELYVGGYNVARSYLNRPGLTAERFIPDPFSSEPGARLYKTGDLARFLPDGSVEFLGRLDHQVKVRGFRVELGEIAATLAKHPAVREVTVLSKADAHTGQRVVAYLVVDADASPSVDELRDFMKERLPDYMVPSSFVQLDALPRTAHGKLDVKALPAPDQSTVERTRARVGPRDIIEEVLATIWEQLLGVEELDVNDNFFEIGGHSLLATQVISRARESFRVELPLRTLFEHPTVAGLAAQVGAARQTQSPLAAVPITRVDRDEQLPLSFAQHRLWFLDRLEPDTPVYNIPATGRLTGRLNLRALELTVGEIVRRHEALRTTFPDVQGKPMQVIAPPSPVSILVLNLTHLPEADRELEARRLAAEEARRPFNLAKGPLWRISLVRMAEDDHLVLLTMHHIVSDNWSIGILTRELMELYGAFAAGRPSPLPELPVQYADFSRWQREWLQGEVLRTQLDYWKGQLGGALPVLHLPGLKPRPAVQTYCGARHQTTFPASTAEALKALSKRESATLFMTLLAAFKTLLYRYTWQENILVGSPIANRNRVEIEGLIGFFVNTLVLRTDLSGDPRFTDLLGRVREVTLGAYTHQDLPFEKLVEHLQPERNLSQSPLFQVVFALQNAPVPALNLPGLAAGRLDIDSGTTHFDLTVVMEDTAEGLVASVEYSTDLFDESYVERMMERFGTILEEVARHPETRLVDIPLAPGGEQEAGLTGPRAGVSENLGFSFEATLSQD